MRLSKTVLALLVVLAVAVVWVAFRYASGAPTLDTQTFELQYLVEGEAVQLIRPYVFEDRPGAPGSISASSSALTVRETPDNLGKVRRVLAEFDRPKPAVRLHFQLIEADGATAVDPAIAEVETELRKLFRYQGYRLLTEAFVGGTEGSHVEQAVGTDRDEWMVSAFIESVRTMGDSGVVRVRAGVRGMRGAFETTVNARFGQTFVVGNAQLIRDGRTLILTVRPEVVN